VTPRLLVVLAVTGCADPIGHARPDAAIADDAPGPTTGKLATTQNPDGTYTTVVDAQSMTAWTYADFETRSEVAETAAWDLRFQRFHISANGGVSGAGGVELAPVTGVAFAAVVAPATGFVTDAADGDGDGVPDYVLDQGDSWYAYDVGTHVLTPRPIVWVVHTDGGSTIKLEILRYYDAAGTSGWLTLHWGIL
jgi:hypothetical protein